MLLTSKNKVKQIEIIGNQVGQGKVSNYQRLYDYIQKGKVKTEEDIENIFFPNSKNKKASTKRLIRQLENRLLNTVFFIDLNTPLYTDFQKAFYHCSKMLGAFQILRAKGADKAGIPLAEKILKKAIRYEFANIVLELAKQLRLYYGANLRNRKKFKYYDNLVKEYQPIYLSELKAEQYYASLQMHLSNSSTPPASHLSRADKYAKELSEIIQHHSSYRLNLYAFLTIALRHQIANDYKQLLLTSQEAIEFFQKKKHINSNSTTFFFSFRMLSCFVMLQNFGEVKKMVKKCLSLIPEGHANWYYTLEYHIISSFHAKDFQKAYDIYKQATSHATFKVKGNFISEHWRLYEAFIYYFIYTGKIKPDEGNPVKKFRLSKFLNEVPISSKDKRGLNITILIIQILFLLQQKKYPEIIDRIEPLKAYVHRYLRKDDTFRSNCFIKMLMQLPAGYFHPISVAHKADKYWKKLQSVPLPKANQNAELEPVPYEMLWEYVLASLDNKPIKPRR